MKERIKTKKPGPKKPDPTKRGSKDTATSTNARAGAKAKQGHEQRGPKAKLAALAELDSMLQRPGATYAGDENSSKEEETPLPRLPKGQALQADPLTTAVGGTEAQVAPPPTPATLSRFERCLIRAQKGEPGPIRLADLRLDAEVEKLSRKTGQVEVYKKILEGSPQAQPGRPLVNIFGESDDDLAFDLLSLHELVIAARELGREQLQVSLVRLTPEEASALKAQPTAPAPEIPAAQLTPLDIARVNGFMELRLEDIHRDENIRQKIDDMSSEFRNLAQSIQTIGLQNPPVVEVREDQDGSFKLVCVSGHRRLLALESLGVDRVMCALKIFESERKRALAGLAENINREDLHFLDKADGYGLLAKEGMNSHEIAALLDSDPRTISKFLRASAWDRSVKERVRDLGNKATIRFMLNTLAAGERTTAELHAMIDRFTAQDGDPRGRAKPPKGRELRHKIEEFCSYAGYGASEKTVIEKALRYLGFLA